MNLKKTISCILCAAVATSLSLSAAPANKEKDSAKAAKGMADKPAKSGAKEAKGAEASKTGDQKMMSKPEAKGSKGGGDFMAKASMGKNGFFVGGGLSFAMAPSAILPSSTNTLYSSGFGVGVEVVGGYQYYFSSVLDGKLGVRGFGRAEYSIMGFSGTKGATGAFGLLFGADVIYDVARLEKMTVSVYTGMYLGFHAWHGDAMKPGPTPTHTGISPDTVFFSMGSSLGTLLQLSQSSTVDIYVRFPWFAHSSSKAILAIYGPLALGANYIYKF